MSLPSSKKVWVPVQDNRVFAEGHIRERLPDQRVRVSFEGKSGVPQSVDLAEQEVLYADPDYDTHKDNTQLTYLNAANLFENTVRRFRASFTHPDRVGEIYTNTGWVLTAINPYQRVDLYSREMMDKYYGKSMAAVPPHPYAVAETAYHNMIADRGSQCVIVTGESGAGKTETSKVVMQYLTHVSGNRHRHRRNEGIEFRVLATNPILESFGNAKTVRNDNSSRFGKMMRLNFFENGEMHTASIETYLLAKSRVTQVPPGERNYHVFYALVEGVSEAERAEFLLGKMKTSDFAFLRSAAGRVEASVPPFSLDQIKKALGAVGVSPAVQTDIFRVLMAILFLGNVKFSSVRGEGVRGEEGDACQVSAESREKEGALLKAAALLGLTGPEKGGAGAGALEAALTKKKIVGEFSNLSVQQAQFARDALCKALFSRLFDLVVGLCNRGLEGGGKGGGSSSPSSSSSGSPSPSVELSGEGGETSAEIEMSVSESEAASPFMLSVPESSRGGEGAVGGRQGCRETATSRPHAQSESRGGNAGAATVARQQRHRPEPLSSLSTATGEEGLTEDGGGSAEKFWIGILDIFGFEDMEPESRNSFEQCCINFCNEQLQQLFFEEMIRKEKLTHAQEAVPFKEVEFEDNADLIECFAGRGGVFDVLDEVARAPIRREAERDEKFCSRVNTEIAKKDKFAKFFAKPRGGQGRERFVVNHFAATVEYTAASFSEKNSDALSNDLEGLLFNSSPFISSHLTAEAAASPLGRGRGGGLDDVWGQDSEGGSSCLPASSPSRRTFSSSLRASSPSPSPSPVPRRRGGNAGAEKSLGVKFARQVEELIHTLKKAYCHFIRCIKPNDSQKPKMIDRRKIFLQLQNSGMMALLRVMKDGFPCRVPYKMLWDQYAEFLPQNMRAQMKPPDFVEMILRYLRTPEEDFYLGNTRAFFRFGALAEVERIKQCHDPEERQRFVEEMYHFWFEKRKKRMRAWTRTAGKFLLAFKKQRAEALARSAKAFFHSRMLPQLKAGAQEKISSLWTVVRAQQEKRRKVRQIVAVQALFRSFWARKEAREYGAAVRIQSRARGMWARKVYRQLRADALARQKMRSTEVIQRWWRGARVRLHNWRRKKVLWLWTRLQARWRGRAARRSFQKMKQDAVRMAIEQAKQAERERLRREMEEERRRQEAQEEAARQRGEEEKRRHEAALLQLREEMEARERERAEKEEAERQKQKEQVERELREREEIWRKEREEEKLMLQKEREKHNAEIEALQKENAQNREQEKERMDRLQAQLQAFEAKLEETEKAKEEERKRQEERQAEKEKQKEREKEREKDLLEEERKRWEKEKVEEDAKRRENDRKIWEEEEKQRRSEQEKAWRDEQKKMMEEQQQEMKAAIMREMKEMKEREMKDLKEMMAAQISTLSQAPPSVSARGSASFIEEELRGMHEEGGTQRGTPVPLRSQPRPRLTSDRTDAEGHGHSAVTPKAAARERSPGHGDSLSPPASGETEKGHSAAAKAGSNKKWTGASVVKAVTSLFPRGTKEKERVSERGRVIAKEEGHNLGGGSGDSPKESADPHGRVPLFCGLQKSAFGAIPDERASAVTHLAFGLSSFSEYWNRTEGEERRNRVPPSTKSAYLAVTTADCTLSVYSILYSFTTGDIVTTKKIIREPHLDFLRVTALHFSGKLIFLALLRDLNKPVKAQGSSSLRFYFLDVSRNSHLPAVLNIEVSASDSNETVCFADSPFSRVPSFTSSKKTWTILQGKKNGIRLISGGYKETIRVDGSWKHPNKIELTAVETVRRGMPLVVAGFVNGDVCLLSATRITSPEGERIYNLQMVASIQLRHRVDRLLPIPLRADMPPPSEPTRAPAAERERPNPSAHGGDPVHTHTHMAKHSPPPPPSRLLFLVTLAGHGSATVEVIADCVNQSHVEGCRLVLHKYCQDVLANHSNSPLTAVFFPLGSELRQLAFKREAAELAEEGGGRGKGGSSLTSRQCVEVPGNVVLASMGDEKGKGGLSLFPFRFRQDEDRPIFESRLDRQTVENLEGGGGVIASGRVDFPRGTEPRERLTSLGLCADFPVIAEGTSRGKVLFWRQTDASQQHFAHRNHAQTQRRASRTPAPHPPGQEGGHPPNPAAAPDAPMMNAPITPAPPSRRPRQSGTNRRGPLSPTAQAVALSAYGTQRRFRHTGPGGKGERGHGEGEESGQEEGGRSPVRATFLNSGLPIVEDHAALAPPDPSQHSQPAVPVPAGHSHLLPGVTPVQERMGSNGHTNRRRNGSRSPEGAGGGRVSVSVHKSYFSQPKEVGVLREMMSGEETDESGSDTEAEGGRSRISRSRSRGRGRVRSRSRSRARAWVRSRSRSKGGEEEEEEEEGDGSPSKDLPDSLDLPLHIHADGNSHSRPDSVCREICGPEGGRSPTDELGDPDFDGDADAEFFSARECDSDETQPHVRVYRDRQQRGGQSGGAPANGIRYGKPDR